jgi:hypothetical protein
MDDEVKAAFGKVWPVHVQSLTRFLIECRRAFDGDLDMFLVLAVIGDRTYSQQHADPDMTYDAFRSGHASQTEAIDINLRSIAEFSGIPRETVRRKLNDLLEKGWVRRNANGSLTATRTASDDLQPLTLASITYIADMLRLFSAFTQPTAAKTMRQKRIKPHKKS